MDFPSIFSYQFFFHILKLNIQYKKKKIAEKKDIYEPKLLTAFQPLIASGKSGILLGIPASPKKCIGKKVIFTPIKNNQKCI